MSGAVLSRLDASIQRLLRARRRVGDRGALEKLALLRRLEHRHVIRDLPETRVEQSFNEQLFARVLGYRTLLSHDELSFHLLPKNATGPRRFDDFSIGFFGGLRDVVFGSAEFKGPGTDLDAPQTNGSYGGQSPVQQAFAAAATLTACRWIVVSNFRELRLYVATDAASPIAVADLHEVRSRDDLASLQAHFDRMALLPADEDHEGIPEMTHALATDFPGAPLEAAAGCYRVVARFTPSQERVLALLRLELSLRTALESSGELDFFFKPDQYEPARVGAVEMRDGWVWTEGNFGAVRSIRVAVSRAGQVIVSARFKHDPHPGVPRQVLLSHVIQALSVFCRAVAGLFGFDFVGLRPGPMADGVMGEVGLEFREVQGAAIKLRNGQSLNEGRVAQQDVFAGEFSAHVPYSVPSAIAACLSDLVIQFRSSTGGLVLNPDEVAEELRERASTKAE